MVALLRKERIPGVYKLQAVIAYSHWPNCWILELNTSQTHICHQEVNKWVFLIVLTLCYLYHHSCWADLSLPIRTDHLNIPAGIPVICYLWWGSSCEEEMNLLSLKKEKRIVLDIFIKECYRGKVGTILPKCFSEIQMFHPVIRVKSI